MIILSTFQLATWVALTTTHFRDVMSKVDSKFITIVVKRHIDQDSPLVGNPDELKIWSGALQSSDFKSLHTRFLLCTCCSGLAAQGGPVNLNIDHGEKSRDAIWTEPCCTSVCKLLTLWYSFLIPRWNPTVLGTGVYFENKRIYLMWKVAKIVHYH